MKFLVLLCFLFIVQSSLASKLHPRIDPATSELERHSWKVGDGLLRLGSFLKPAAFMKTSEDENDKNEIDINSKIRVDETEFEEKSEAWMRENQQSVRDSMRWIIMGAFMYLVSMGVFLFSEIRHAIVVRDLDQHPPPPSQLPDDLVERKRTSDSQRPFLTLGATGGMAVASFMTLATLCAIVSELLEAVAGYRFRGCWYVAAIIAILAAAAWALLLLAACWICVRPFAATACLLAGIVGTLALLNMDWSSVVLWVAGVGISSFLLLRYGGPRWQLDAARRGDDEKSPLLP